MTCKGGVAQTRKREAHKNSLQKRECKIPHKTIRIHDLIILKWVTWKCYELVVEGWTTYFDS
jgi:hypothetical protein